MFEVDDRLSPLPAELPTTPPGPRLEAMVARVDREECNGAELEELIRARRRLIARLEAECLADVAALAHCPPGLSDSPARRVPHPDPHGAAVLEPLLGWTASHTDWYLHLALVLRALPRTRRALATGELEVGEVRVIADRLAVLRTADQRTRAEAALFPDVVHLRAGLLRMRVESEVIRIDPAAATERHRRARSDRGVDLYPTVDGVADLRLHGVPADQATEAYAYLDAIARSVKSSGDARTLPQLRADIAASLLTGQADVDSCESTSSSCPHTGCAHEHHDRFCPCADCKPAGVAAPTGAAALARIPSADDNPRPTGTDAPVPTGIPAPPGIPDQRGERGEVPTGRPGSNASAAAEVDGVAPSPGGPPKVAVRARIQLNVPLTTLLGLGSRPAELGGYGPVVTEVTRRLVANHLDNPDARFAVGVTDPVSGRLLHLHPLPRRFLRGLRAELVEALNQRCTWMVCRRPADTCQLDHTTSHASGGRTAVDNMAPLCPRHHAVKTESAWQVSQSEPGHFTFTDPHGRIHPVQPPRLTDRVSLLGPGQPPGEQQLAAKHLGTERLAADDPDPPPF